jgi:response regulator RpfG family c-di-GMP phosphodiesterase
VSFFSLAVLISGTVASVALVVYVLVYLPQLQRKRSLESMRAFSTAIELRFPTHRGMTDEVVRLSLGIATALHLSAQDRYHLEMAAHLRDIGLCAIPYALVNRSPMHLSEAEEATYDRHKEVSGAMLELVPSLRHLAEVVRHHHMRHSDYPNIVDGHQYTPPMIAEILNVATGYAWQVHRDGHTAGRAHVIAESGHEYHPAAAQALLGVITSTRVDEPLRRAVV